jgi:hypothetical protein
MIWSLESWPPGTISDSPSSKTKNSALRRPQVPEVPMSPVGNGTRRPRFEQGSPDNDAMGVVNKFVDAQGTGEHAHSIVARHIAVYTDPVFSIGRGLYAREWKGIVDVF